MSQPTATSYPLVRQFSSNESLKMIRIGGAFVCLALLVNSGLFVECVTEGGSDPSLKFQLEPEGTVVAEGSAISLHCRPLLDSLLAHIRWRFNGVSLSQSPDRELLSNGSLLLKNVRTIDQGNYQCQVALPSGGFLLSKLAFLQLAELEVDRSVTSVSLTLLLGQTARLACGVRGHPTPSVQWLKNGLQLQLDETRVLQLPGQHLEIQSLQLDDQAEYTCRGTNSAGAASGPTHQIHVSVDIDEASQPTVPQFAVKPSDTVIGQGQEVTLHCAANGYPQPTVVWLKDGNTIDMSFLDRRFYLIGISSLQIIDVRPSDAGNYQCRAFNAVDSVDTSAVLTVNVPPVLVSLPSNTEAVEQQDVQLVCAAEGTPQPSIVWTKDGELLHQSKYFRITERKLRILGLVSRDSGIYQCFATNTAGTVQAAARLTVLPAASVNVTLDSRGSTRVLNAGSTVSPPGLVPSAPRNITARVVGPRFVALTWRPPANLGHLVSGYTIMYRQVGSERLRVQNVSVPEDGAPSLQVQDLLPDTEYTFRLAALSSTGHGQVSGSLQLRTAAEPESSAAPQQLRVTAVGSTQLAVRWQAVVPPPLVYTLTLEPVSGGRQLLINTSDTSLQVTQLQKYTQYRIRVSAVNQQGPGASSVPVLARTWSDVPSAPPQNVTVETISDTSVEVHWLPPPVDRCNGPLTGYKLRYRLSSSSSLHGEGGVSRRSHSVVTDASRHSYRLGRLLQQAEYQIKLAALTVNGTGPFTRWMRAHTYRRQQAEISVPGRPGSLRARPTATSITALWTPPADRTVRVRGYTLGWGRGVPDLHAVVVPDDQYHYVIRQLVPGAEYVLSLRALNAAGNGTPVYETLWTRSAAEVDDGGDRIEQFAMTMPTGLKVDSVSETAMVLHWSDLSLPSQEAVDERVYRVRYNIAGDTTFRYYNSTTTNCMIDRLQPDTLYEFSVQTIVDDSASGWSMLQTNRTREAAPGSPPRDITAVPSDNDPTTVSVHWQPPKRANGKIHGYLVQYSEDRELPPSQWRVQAVPGASLTTTLQSLRPSISYWVRVQARNAVGPGPMSRPVKLVTEIGAVAEGARGSLNNDVNFSGNLLYVVVSCAVTAVLLLAAVCSVCLYKRKSASSNTSRRTNKNGYIKGQQSSTMGGCSSPDLKPPDLWIHHRDQMELGGLTGARRSGSCSSIARRSSRSDIDTVLPDARSYIGSTLERRRLGPVTAAGAFSCPSPPASTVTGSYLSDDYSDSTYHRHSGFRPPIVCIDAHSPRPLHALVSTSTLTGSAVETRPIYPHSQFTIARGGSLIDPPPPAPCVPAESHYGAGLGMISASSSEAGGPAGYLSGPSVAPIPSAGYSSSVASSSDSSCLHQRLLEQHGVTATLAAAAVAAGVSSFGIHPAVSAPLSVASQSGQSVLQASPLRRPPPFACAPLSNGDVVHEELMPLRPAYSTEELTQEMANLEGLMKDLSVITASEFQC